MIVISNGVNTFTVTKGAYRSLYIHQGYKVVSVAGASAPAPEADPLMTGMTQDGRNGAGVGSTPSGDENGSSIVPGPESTISSDEDISDEEYDADEADSLEETPISDMTAAQLRRYAEKIGVELDGTETKKELRQLIRENLG